MAENALSLIHGIRRPQAGGEQAPPALILLHGVGSNERDLLQLAPYFDPRLFVIGVRAPRILGPDAFGWYSIQFTDDGPIHQPSEAEESRKAVIRFLKEAVAAYRLDPERIYLGGFSQGSIMTLAVALTEPERLAGAIVLNGRYLPQIDEDIATADRLTGLPILVQHGLYDSVLPISDGRKIRDRLKTLPVALTYREYPMAHEINQQSLTDAAQWLTEHVSGPASQRIIG